MARKNIICLFVVLLLAFLVLSSAPIVQAQPSTGPNLTNPVDNAYKNDNTLDFKWENIDTENITHYRLVIDNSPNFDDGDNFYDNRDITDNRDDFNTHPENALPEGTWYWKVQAENANGWGPFSETRTLHVDITRPQITSVTVSDNLITDSDVGGLKFEAIVTFNENMKTNMPGVNFAPDVEQDTLIAYSAGWIDNKNFRMQFTENDANVENQNIDVLVSQGAVDLAGNDFVFNEFNRWRENDKFSVDTLNPTVSLVTVSHPVINSDNAGQIFTVTVQFDETMDNTVNPTISFTPDVTADTLTAGPMAWSADTIYFYENFTITDAEVENANVDVGVSGGKDIVGNTQTTYTATNLFDIDTKNPTITSMTVSDNLITDADVGGLLFTLDIYFSENMYTGSPYPTVTYIPDVFTSTLNPVSGTWVSPTQHRRTYTIADVNVNIVNLDISVQNARDNAGNLVVPLQDNDKFSIDTQNPTVASVLISNPTIADSVVGHIFDVTVIYNETMNTAISPELAFIPPVATTLTPCIISGTWQPDNLTYIADYDILDGNVEVTGVDILIENARDENNNIMSSYLENDKFNIDTLSPTVVSATASPDPANAGIVTVTVVFSENMDNGVSPTVQVTGPISSPFSVTETSYVGDTWTGTFKLYDYNEVATATISVSGAEDLVGHVMDPAPSAGTFDVDTVAPTPRGPIFIENDDFFNYDNGVNGGGTGTQPDPYIIENFIIDASSAHGIRVENTTKYFVIQNCLVENGGSYHGIYLDNVINGKIEKNTCGSNYYGIYLNYSDNNILDNNTCGSNNHGIYLSYSDNCTIDNNTCGSNSSFGIRIGDSSYVNLTNNTCSDTVRGIYLNYSDNNILDNNTCSNNSDYGIRINNSDYCTISNNTCSNNSNYGINLDYSRYNTIENNTCSNNDDGIYLYDESDYNDLINNTCSNNYNGIYLDDSWNCIISNNTCESNEYGIDLDQSDYNTLLNNTLTGNDYGFYVWESDHNWIENNTILATSQYNFGSCPFLYTWDGDSYTFVADLAGNGILAVPRGDGFRSPRPEDYVKIEGSQFQLKDGVYTMQITQEYDEISYVDELSLITIDHSPDVDVYPALLRTELSKIYTVSKTPLLPISCVEEDGSDCLPQVLSKDQIYTEATGTKIDIIELDFGDLSDAEEIKLILSGYTEWIPGTAGISRVRGKFIQVKDGDGNWVSVFEDNQLDNPAAMPRTYVINLTGKFLTDDYSVRIGSGASVRWDYIAVDTTPQQAVITNSLPLVSADLHYRGYSEFKGETPRLPDYGNVSAIPPAGFSDPAGNFTRFGDVLPLITETDDKFVIMHHGDEISLEFDYNPISEGMERDFILYTWDYYKNRYYETGGTVNPLPFSNMSTYPYPDNESYPSDAEHLAYLSEWNTREYVGGEGVGMSLPYSDNNTVIGNTIIGDSSCVGLMLVYEINTSILNNTISETGDAILVYDSWNCIISNNTVENNFGDGIGLGGSEDCLIENNTCSNNDDDGIQVSDCGYIGLINNTCSNNSDDGIYIDYSEDCNIENNTCENNGDGIYVDESCCIDLINNNCSNNSDDGIYIDYSEDCNIENNTCENNSDGIYVDESCCIDLINNNCSNNSDDGIYIDYSEDCNIYNNTCENNSDGIYVDYCDYIDLINNTCSNNDYGIYLYDSDDCYIFHNYLLNNTENNAYDDSGNDWDDSGEGNYWSDWQPPEHPDNDGDGIVDEARPILGGAEDYYPLVLPDFSISVSPTSRSVQAGSGTTATVSLTPVPTVENFAVSLTASGQPSGVSVSFSPSSGVPPSSPTMAINVGSNVPGGTYTITVKGMCVADRERTSIFTLKVSTILPSGYSTGAGTITPAAPVTVQIQNSPVTGLQINVNSTVQNVNVTVTQSTSTPAGISIGAPGATYSYLDITVQNLSDANIDYVVISFKVEKSWLNANGIDPTTVALYRYSGGVWAALPTERVSEDATYVYYSARSPGFSVFSISGYAKVTPTPPAPTPPPPSPGPLPEPTPGGAAPPGMEWLVILGGAVAIVIALLGVILPKKLKL